MTEDQQPDGQEPGDTPDAPKMKTGAYIAVGVGVGAALGVAMGNIAVGIAMGVAIGAAMAASKRKK